MKLKNQPGGKGHEPRPMDIDRKKFEENFERIFGGKQKDDAQKEHDRAQKGNE